MFVIKKSVDVSFNKVGVQGKIFPSDKLIQNAEFIHIYTKDGHQTEIIEKECDFVYYILKGDSYFIINNEKYTCSTGDLVVIPKGTRFTYKGELEMLLIVTPPFWPEQEETI